MSRPIGLRRPSRPPPVRHDVSPPGHSQSQESTQQPSIEIRPTATLAHPFRTSSRAQTEPPRSATPGDRALAQHSSDRAIGQTSSDGAIGSSSEETGESGLEWTQQQLEKNQQAEAKLAAAEGKHLDVGLEPIREASEGAITSPEAPIRASGPKWAFGTPEPTRPSTPVTEGDQLDQSIPQEDFVNGGLEATEVDDSPSIPSPSTSPQIPISPLPRNHLPVPPTIPTKTSPRKVLSPMTNFSPKLTIGHLPSAALNSPSRAVGSRTSLGFKRTKKGNTGDIEDSFGQDPKIRVNPLERINGLMRKHSEAQVDCPNDVISKEGPNIRVVAEDSVEMSAGSERRLKGASNGVHHSDGQGGGGSQSSDHMDVDGQSEEHDQDGNSAEEDENAAINWEQTIPPIGSRGQTELDLNHEDPNSPVPSLSIQHRLSTTTLSPPTSPHVDRSHFRQFANSGSTSSSRIGDPGGLFSSQDFSNDFDQPTQTQQSQMFQPTQMMPRSTSPILSASNDPTQLQMELEATQPDSQPVQAESGEQSAHPVVEVGFQPDEDNFQKVNSALPGPPVSRIPSVASTTTSSRIEVPAHRQLQRRSRADDGSMVSPFTAQVPQLPWPAAREMLRPDPLQQRQSEVLPPASVSSPFKKVSPPRRSSEPPMLQETLQESSDGPQAYNPTVNGQPGLVVTPPSSPRPAFFHSMPPQPSPPHPPSPTTLAKPKLPALEETVTDGPSLPALPAVRPSPVKQYAGPSKRRRILDTPSPPRRRAQQGSSSESSATPEDLEDHTYQPTAGGSKTSVPFTVENRMLATRPVGSSKRKRSTSPASPLSPLPGSDDESSSAPEDPEDNTYQPSLLVKVKGVKGKDKGKGKERSTQGPSRAPSPERDKKRPKTNGQVGRNSTPLSTVASASPGPASAPNMDLTRVLALYQSHFYPAKILGKVGQTYSIQFDDGDTKPNVPTHHLRQLILRKGETLQASRRTNDMPLSFEVAEDWDGDEAGVVCQSGKKRLGRIPLDRIAVKKALIGSAFGDRLFKGAGVDLKVSNGTIGERLAAREARASIPRSPVKQRAQDSKLAAPRPPPSPSPVDDNSGIFNRMLFLLTRSPKTDHLSEEIKGLLRMNGGKMADKWETMFDRSSPGQCTFAGDLEGIPFVVPIGEKLVMTTKLMVALAKGIPCVSPQYIKDSIAEGKLLDWRAYLISPGYSEHTGHYASQCVDPLWGAANWEPRTALPLRRPLRGKKVLFISPTTGTYAMLKSSVPVCLYLLGVEELLTVQHVKSNEKIMRDRKWDYVLFETRDKTIPSALKNAENVCDIHWLKQCLITGAVLPPGLNENQD
ncbi:hypothetical protein IAT40_005000 [Kwoniella sp. CBS 6097]